ncbi:zinc finger and SCAN domain-containing protein 29-like isoform X2 [Coregonus clupeaformis]|uniref:zinc finger and SCAN domain-containing protein 29-like isoform X2 n=1 Tax=Coregonus clupeaformis TaxID=59861 RepID=UPI001E1C738D|nr:zinc finger and SCAN domain-containing protein 29-like isoform X2 [Coregonus clupeaformis]
MPESRYHWSGEEVNAIVSIWSDEAIQRALRSSDSEYRGAAKVYHEIFVRLRKLGYKGNVQQCRDKLKKLKGQYKEIKANSSDRWSYFPPSWFDAMDAVLGQRLRKPVLRSGKATGSQKNDKSPSSWTPDEPPQTSGSGVRTSASRLLELTDSSEDYDKSPSSWTPDEDHGQQSEASGFGEINATTLLFESTPDSAVDEEHTEESGYHWSPKEVQALLTLWANDSVQKQLLSYKNEHVYAKFSSELAALGFNRTSKQCRDKLKKLKQEYRRVKDDNNKSGSNHRGERWFAIIDSVLCHQPRLWSLG